MNLRVFIDTDVIISSTISQKGAAYYLLNTERVEKSVTNYTILEALNVANRIGLNLKTVKIMLSLCSKTSLKLPIDSLEDKYRAYVSDLNDTHVVAGAVNSKSRYLVTYNIRDFNIEFIKKDYGIIVLNPGTLLQYLRSRE